jgi:sensor histidine kinase regulating citrate/malate metabolism
MPLYGEAIVVTNFKRLMFSTRLVILLLFFASFLLSLVTAIFLQLGCKNNEFIWRMQL